MQHKSPDGELLPVLYELQVVGVPVPPSPMETVQVVVPHQGDGGHEHSGENKIADRQAKQVVLLTEGALGVDVGCPDVHKELYDVRDDGEGPGDDIPAGTQAGGHGGVVGRRGTMPRGGQATQLHRALL